MIKHTNQLQNLITRFPATKSISNTLSHLIGFMNLNSGAWSCFPKIPTLASKQGKSTRQIMRNLKRLSQMKVVKIKRQYRTCLQTGQRRRVANRYTLNIGAFLRLVQQREQRNVTNECHSNNPLPINKKPRSFRPQDKAAEAQHTYRQTVDREAEQRRQSAVANQVDQKTAQTNCKSLLDMIRRAKGGAIAA